MLKDEFIKQKYNQWFLSDEEYVNQIIDLRKTYKTKG